MAFIFGCVTFWWGDVQGWKSVLGACTFGGSEERSGTTKYDEKIRISGYVAGKMMPYLLKQFIVYTLTAHPDPSAGHRTKTPHSASHATSLPFSPCLTHTFVRLNVLIFFSPKTIIGWQLFTSTKEMLWSIKTQPKLFFFVQSFFVNSESLIGWGRARKESWCPDVQVFFTHWQELMMHWFPIPRSNAKMKRIKLSKNERDAHPPLYPSLHRILQTGLWGTPEKRGQIWCWVNSLFFSE